MAYVRLPDPKRHKLASRAVECVFLGYVTNSKACRFLDIKNNVIFESIDADFYENKFPFKARDSGGSQPPIIVPSRPIDSRVHDRDNDIELEPRRSKRAKLSKDFRPDFYTFILEGDLACLEDALTSSEANFWREAIHNEMDSILSDHT